MELTPERKQEISNIVNRLKQRYDVSSSEGLKRIAEDNDIVTIDDKDVIFPSAYKRPIDNRKIIAIGPTLFKDTKSASYSHELGHLLLGHLESKYEKGTDDFFMEKLKQEEEAEFFVEQLGYKSSGLKGILDTVFSVVTENPITKFRFLFSPSFERGYDKMLVNRVQ